MLAFFISTAVFGVKAETRYYGLDSVLLDVGAQMTGIFFWLTNPASLDLVRSKYDLGGNGFHVGAFLAGSISPAASTISMSTFFPGFVTLSWTPDLPGQVLQEKPDLSTHWVNLASSTNIPAVVPASATKMFYRVAIP